MAVNRGLINNNINVANHSKTISKAELIALLNKYGAHRRTVRFFSGSSSVKKLAHFIMHDLSHLSPAQSLSTIELNVLIEMLRQRFMKNFGKDDYRNAPNEFANKLFRELAELISDDPKILALVQKYQSDYTPHGQLICESKDRLYVTESGYVVEYSQMLAEIGNQNALVTKANRDQMTPLTKNDMNALKKDPAIAAELKRIEKQYYTFVNTENLLAEPLTDFTLDQIFKTEDNYGITIDEILQILKAQNALYNPYTNKPFSQNEKERAMAIPAINQYFHHEAKKNQPLMPETIEQLNILAEGLLNPEELSSDSTNLPIAQKAFEKFNDFYQNLDSREREKLNNRWISNPYNNKSIKFEEYYPTIHASCVHGAGYIIRDLIPQLKIESSMNENRPSFRP